MPELARGPRLFAIVVQMRSGHLEHLDRVGQAPSKFNMPAWPRTETSPSGQPRIALRWFSNWLVSAPSIVQWPELCTRGAISLARSPDDVRKNSTVSTPR